MEGLRTAGVVFLCFALVSIGSPVSPQALAGEVGMSSELDEVARSLFNGQIPAIWKKLAPDTLKSLGNWMSHFKRRYEQYNSWVRMATFNHLLQYIWHLALLW